MDAFSTYLNDTAGHPDVIVHHGGPTLGDDGQTADGLVLVVEAPSSRAVQVFVAGSPYGSAGLLAETRVWRWNWVTGRPGARPRQPPQPDAERRGRVWLTTRVQSIDNPAWCRDGSDNRFAQYFPVDRAGRHTS